MTELIVSEGDFVKLSNITGKTSNGTKIEEMPAGKTTIVIAGKKQVIKGLDESLLGAKKGEKKLVKIPKEKAFGERKNELVRLVPLQKFKEQEITPMTGMQITMDGANARIQSVSGGRVRVDFNHELAGQDLEYEYTIAEVFKTPEEKVVELAKQLDGYKASYSEGTARIKISSKEKHEHYLEDKARFIQTISFNVPEVKKVVFEEEYVKEDKG